jgi:hypothetical protein
MNLDDVARFTERDHEAVVIASLMCPYCLGRPAHVLVDHSAGAATAICACCDLRWSVALDPGQALRLFVAPPGGLWTRHRFEQL